MTAIQNQAAMEDLSLSAHVAMMDGELKIGHTVLRFSDSIFSLHRLIDCCYCLWVEGCARHVSKGIFIFWTSAGLVRRQ